MFSIHLLWSETRVESLYSTCLPSMQRMTVCCSIKVLVNSLRIVLQQTKLSCCLTVWNLPVFFLQSSDTPMYRIVNTASRDEGKQPWLNYCWFLILRLPILWCTSCQSRLAFPPLNVISNNRTSPETLAERLDAFSAILDPSPTFPCWL